SFTVDGIGGPFIEEVEGDYHGVVGLSLPLVRAMVEECGLSITQLWTQHLPARGKLNAQAHHFVDPNHRAPHKSADAFLLCSCGSRHWGLHGAAGICALRKHKERIQVLLQLRAPWSHSGGTWAIPGGAIEWEEDAYEGALREFCEETGIDPANVHPYQPETSAIAHSLDDECDTRIASQTLTAHRPDLYETAKATPCVVLEHEDWNYSTFIVTCPDNLRLHPNNESSHLQWFNIDGELPNPLHPAFAKAWDALHVNAIRAFSH
ncbi:MAG: NUDIX domain-containing protein, partial [Actinomycetaceae bacterium]|nr:NUDIX domain-containing protein [Actinomycetaceae bacterium]